MTNVDPGAQDDTGVTNLLSSELDVGSVVADMLYKQGSSEGPVVADSAPDLLLVRTNSGRKFGPVSSEVILNLIYQGALNVEAEISLDGDEWDRLDSRADFRAALVTAAPRQGDQSVVPPLLQGTSDQLGIGPFLFRVLETEQSGWLRVNAGGISRVVVCRTGRPINVFSTASDESDEALLLEDMRCSAEQVDRAKAFARGKGLNLLNALAETKAIANKAVPEIQRDNALVRLRRLLTCAGAEIRFEADDVAGNENDVLQMDTLSLLRECLEEAEHPRLLTAMGGTPGELVQKKPIDVDGLSQDERTLFDQLAAQTTLGQLLQSSQDPAATARRAFVLAVLDLISVGSAEKRRLVAFLNWLDGQSDFASLGAQPTDAVGVLNKHLVSLREKAAAAAEGVPEDDAVRLRVVQRLDDIDEKLQNPVERHIMTRAAFMGLDATDEAVRNALEAEILESLIRKVAAAGEWKQLRPLAKRQYELTPSSPDAIANYFMSVIYVSDDESEQNEALEELSKGCAEHPRALALQLAVAEGAIHLGRVKKAKRALEAAEELNPNEPRLPALRHHLKGARPGRSNKSSKKLEDIGSDDVAPSFFHVLGLVGGLIVVMMLLGPIFGLGESEHEWDGLDFFWWVRRLSLPAIAFAAFHFMFKRSPQEVLSGLRFEFPPKAIVVAIGIGLLSGALTPPRELDVNFGLILFMVTIHVAAEQIFFTWFLTDELINAFPRPDFGAILSGVLYGMYHLSYSTILLNPKPMWIPYWVILVIIGGGLPYALLYQKTRSVIPSFLCHWLVMVAYMARSAMG